MGSLFLVILNTGILCGFILSNYLRPLYLVPIICTCLLCLYYSILLTYLLDTPQYLLKVGLVDKAKESLKFYWNSIDSKDDVLNAYFDNLRQNITQPKSPNEKHDSEIRLLCKYFILRRINKFHKLNFSQTAKLESCNDRIRVTVCEQFFRSLLYYELFDRHFGTIRKFLFGLRIQYNIVRITSNSWDILGHSDR